jgi:hypothetical protein
MKSKTSSGPQRSTHQDATRGTWGPSNARPGFRPGSVRRRLEAEGIPTNDKQTRGGPMKSDVRAKPRGWTGG